MHMPHEKENHVRKKGIEILLESVPVHGVLRKSMKRTSRHRLKYCMYACSKCLIYKGSDITSTMNSKKSGCAWHNRAKHFYFHVKPKGVFFRFHTEL